MGILDAAFQSVAKTLINTFSDAPATYRRKPVSRYSGRDDEELTALPVTYPIKISPPTVSSKRTSQAVNERELVCYVAASELPLDPDPRTDSLTWRGTVYQVVGSSVIGTADGSVLVELQLKK